MPVVEEKALAPTVVIANDAKNTPSATMLVASALVENPQVVQVDAANISLGEPLPLEERLKQLLEPENEPEDEQESIKATKGFLSDLGNAKLDDPSVVAKIREQAAFLQAHVTGEELATVKALLAKFDALPLLEQAAHQMTKTAQK